MQEKTKETANKTKRKATTKKAETPKSTTTSSKSRRSGQGLCGGSNGGPEAGERYGDLQ